MCAKRDCPIFDTCDKEIEQALYCRKVELMVHLSKIKKTSAPRACFIALPIQQELI